MAGYIGTKAAVVTPGAERKKVFSITTTTSSLTGLVYTPGFVHVFHNGVRLVDGTDYTATNGTSITLTTAAQNGDEVVVISHATFQTSDTVSASAGGTFNNDVAINGDLTVDTNTLFVDAVNNRVGVGTTSPASALDVASGASDSVLSLTATGVQRWQLQTERSTGNFNLHNQTGSSTPVIVTTSGNVGIGTSSPASKFSVSGGASGVATDIDYSGGISTGAEYSALRFTASGLGFVPAEIRGVNTNGGQNLGVMQMFVSGSERARIDSSGSLRLGTTLDFGITNKLTISYAGGGTQYGIVMRPGADSTVPIYFQNAAGTNVGSIFTGTSGTAYNTSSDYRLKENVVPLAGAADRLAQIPVHRFNFIADPDHTVDGFLAHEVQAFVPEAVTGEKDAVDADGNPEYQGIDQSKLVPLLTAALQEALTKIDALEARIVTLEGGAA